MSVLGVATALSACTPTYSAIVTPAYHPQPGPALAGAHEAGVLVTVNDLRANPGKVGNVTGVISNAGTRQIVSGVEVKAVVKSAIEAELAGRGFPLGSGSASVIVDLTQFDVERKVEMGALAGLGPYNYSSEARVLMHVEVKGSDQKNIYSQLISGTSESSELDEQAALNLAFQEAVQKLFKDPGFTQAILAANHDGGGRV